MTSLAFRTATITAAELSAMRADAAKCNARLMSVLKAQAIGDNPENQLERVKREFVIILETANGQPFTVQDAQDWVLRRDMTVKARLSAMIDRGLIVQDGYRGRAKLYRPTNSATQAKSALAAPATPRGAKASCGTLSEDTSGHNPSNRQQAPAVSPAAGATGAPE